MTLWISGAGGREISRHCEDQEPAGGRFPDIVKIRSRREVDFPTLWVSGAGGREISRHCEYQEPAGGRFPDIVKIRSRREGDFPTLWISGAGGRFPDIVNIRSRREGDFPTLWISGAGGREISRHCEYQEPEGGRFPDIVNIRSRREGDFPDSFSFKLSKLQLHEMKMKLFTFPFCMIKPFTACCQVVNKIFRSEISVLCLYISFNSL